ncbi:MAG: hypothetical protein FWE23_07290 [Chitinivibrionia bacterium]|nr:hypothetical protein [Chitinivibrionia bacterium]
MKMMKIFAAILVLATVLLAQTGQVRPRVLAFEEGDDEFAFGVLAGINKGSGFGIVPLIWDRAAFGGMFSFGAELRMYWQRYDYGYLWHRHWHGGYWHGLNWLRTGQDELGWFNDYGWGGIPIYRQYHHGGPRLAFDRNGNLTNELYNPFWNDWRDEVYTRFGINPNFRFMFHPFGMPSLRGKVDVARHIDPYIGFKIGASLIFDDKDDPFIRKGDRVRFEFPEFNWYVIGLRWYFREHVSLMTEISQYDFSIGFSFNF